MWEDSAVTGSAKGTSAVANYGLHTVVGVMPAVFRFPSAETDVWTPLAFDAEGRQNRADHYLLVVGRLAASASAVAAQTEMREIAARLAA